MARIFLVGSHLNYNLEHYTKMACESLGHEVSFFGYREILGRSASVLRMIITRSASMRTLSKYIFLNDINERLKSEVAKVKPDLVLSIKGEVVLAETLDWLKGQLGAKLALWYPDDPRYFRSLVNHIAPHYDYIFTASERAIEMYREIGAINVDYLPFGCEPSVHRRVALNETDRASYTSDICFVGTYTRRRAKIIKSVWKAGLRVRVWGPYWKNFIHGGQVSNGIYGLEMVKAFNGAKIVLNMHEESDLPYKVNTRVFEATGSGTFLLTDNSYGLNQMFRIGEEVVAYNDIKELIKTIKYYLNSDEKKDISDKAMRRAHREHTYQQRVTKLLKTTGCF
jgi:spore maturation protein CgeB